MPIAREIPIFPHCGRQWHDGDRVNVIDPWQSYDSIQHAMRMGDVVAGNCPDFHSLSPQIVCQPVNGHSNGRTAYPRRWWNYHSFELIGWHTHCNLSATVRLLSNDEFTLIIFTGGGAIIIPGPGAGLASIEFQILNLHTGGSQPVALIFNDIAQYTGFFGAPNPDVSYEFDNLLPENSKIRQLNATVKLDRTALQLVNNEAHACVLSVIVDYPRQPNLSPWNSLSITGGYTLAPIESAPHPYVPNMGYPAAGVLEFYFNTYYDADQ